jgi:branched-chain amino acid transport system substrate-binding protein
MLREALKGLRRRAVPISCAALVAVSLSACSSSSSSSSGGGSSSTSLGAEHKATGTPINIGFISPGKSATTDESNETAAAKAAVQYVNTYRDGANGHVIKMVTCETLESSTGATACTNQMIQAGVAAVLLGVEGVGNLVEPPLEKAGIPYIITEAGSQAELFGSLTYNLTSSIAGLTGGPALYAQQHGMTQVDTLVLGLPTLAGAFEQFAPIPFKSANVGYKTISVPVGTADMTPYVQTALKDSPQMLLVAGDPGFCGSVLKAETSLGFTGKIMMFQQCLDASTPSAAGGSLAGMMSQTFYNTAGPEFKVFLAVLAKYAPGTSSGGAAPDGYSVVVSFADAMTKAALTSTDSAGISAAMTTAKDVPLSLGDGIVFSCGTKPIPLIPSACSSGINIATLGKTGATASSKNYDVASLFK